MYRDKNIGKDKSVRGKFHAYFCMDLDYTTKVEVNIDMQKYVKTLLMNFDKYRKIPGSRKPSNQKYISGGRK